jgi:hypothetical protein
MPGCSVEVADLGLHLEDALVLDLQTEKFMIQSGGISKASISGTSSGSVSGWN